MALGVNFDGFGSLCAPVPGLLVYLFIDVELVQEGLEVTSIIDGYKASLELLGEGQIIVSVSLTWWFSATSSIW